LADQTTIRLRLRDVSKRFGSSLAVDGVSVDVRDGEFLVLLGPSGCGKTTLLRMIAGFIRPDSGAIELDGNEIASIQRMLPPERRNMAMVFQSYALWPNKNIFENVAFGLKLKKLPKSEIENQVADALRLVKMEGYQKRYPSQLSGGEQQRIALARALIVRPTLFLFDEPLSNLDASLREELRFELKELQVKLAITSIYVTHDQTEAMVMADRVAVMQKGRIQQLAPPKTIYEHPATRFVSSFIGQTNLIRGEIQTGGAGGDLVEILTELGPCLRIPGKNIHSDGQGCHAVEISIRPENISLSRLPLDGGINQFKGQVVRKFGMGSYTDYRIRIGAQVLRVHTHPDQDFNIGGDVFIGLPAAKCHCIVEQSDKVAGLD
jgi:iron(III) transport system ATP-binding protein